MIWVIEAVFLGKYFIGLLMGFALIYFLRAWTEERHLAMDKDYRDYQKQVPYRFIPGVI
jgi:protein-S-isoprenylcysteine O-methyltransferase Ste14